MKGIYTCINAASASMKSRKFSAFFPWTPTRYRRGRVADAETTLCLASEMLKDRSRRYFFSSRSTPGVIARAFLAFVLSRSSRRFLSRRSFEHEISFVARKIVKPRDDWYRCEIATMFYRSCVLRARKCECARSRVSQKWRMTSIKKHLLWEGKIEKIIFARDTW